MTKKEYVSDFYYDSEIELSDTEKKYLIKVLPFTQDRLQVTVVAMGLKKLYVVWV